MAGAQCIPLSLSHTEFTNILTLLVWYLSSDWVSSHCSFQSLNAFITFPISHATGPHETLFISDSLVSILPLSLSSCAGSQFEYFHLEVGSCSVTLIDLKLPVDLRMASNLQQFSCLYLPNSGIKMSPQHICLFTSFCHHYPHSYLWECSDCSLELFQCLYRYLQSSLLRLPVRMLSGMATASLRLKGLTLWSWPCLNPSSVSWIPIQHQFQTLKPDTVYLVLPYLWPKGPLLVQFPLVC